MGTLESEPVDLSLVAGSPCFVACWQGRAGTRSEAKGKCRRQRWKQQRRKEEGRASVRRRHGGSVHYFGRGGPLTRRHEVRLLLPSWLAPPPLLWPPGHPAPLHSPQGLHSVCMYVCMWPCGDRWMGRGLVSSG